MAFPFNVPAYRGDWSSTTASTTTPMDLRYITNNIVTYTESNGAVNAYICLTDNTTEEPSRTATDWRLYSTGGTGGGTPPAPFSIALSGDFSGSQSFAGTAVGQRTVTITPASGTIASATVAGLTPAPTVTVGQGGTSATFAYTPTTDFAGESFTVTAMSTDTPAATATATSRLTYFNPFFVVAAQTAPTDLSAGAQNGAWRLDAPFTVTGNAQGDRLYVAVRLSEVTNPELAVQGGFVEPIGMPTSASLALRSGEMVLYNVYDFGPIDTNRRMFTVNRV